MGPSRELATTLKTEVATTDGNSDAALAFSQRLGGIDPESATGRSEDREQADHNHERRSGGRTPRMFQPPISSTGK